jgi:hypothetical protein
LCDAIKDGGIVDVLVDPVVVFVEYADADVDGVVYFRDILVLLIAIFGDFVFGLSFYIKASFTVRVYLRFL